MNFILANLDFGKMSAEDFRQIHLLSLAEGFPAGWTARGDGSVIAKESPMDVFHPALHGSDAFLPRRRLSAI